MFRFTIRDGVWLTVVQLMAFCWWLRDYSRTVKEVKRADESMEAAKQSVRELKDRWEKAEREGLKLPEFPEEEYRRIVGPDR